MDVSHKISYTGRVDVEYFLCSHTNLEIHAGKLSWWRNLLKLDLLSVIGDIKLASWLIISH